MRKVVPYMYMKRLAIFAAGFFFSEILRGRTSALLVKVGADTSLVGGSDGETYASLPQSYLASFPDTVTPLMRALCYGLEGAREDLFDVGILTDINGLFETERSRQVRVRAQGGLFFMLYFFA